MKLFYRYGLPAAPTRYIGFILFFFTQFNTSSYPQLPDDGKVKPLEKNYSEELYIKTDRDLYISGEKVWLKIYKLNGLTHTPSNLSKVVYVDVFDADNNPVKQLKIGIDGYSGSGDFRLPDTLRTGNYFLRSYTNWMQNFSEDLFSYKKISVVNPFKISDIKIPLFNQSADSIIFSPEGGHLIAGVESRIGFKCINKEGDPVNMSGAIIIGEKDTLCHVQTENNGFGWATIKPSDQKKIFLVTLNNDRVNRRFQLPHVQNEGILLSVPQKSEKSPVLVRVIMSHNIAPSGSNLFLVLNSPGLSGFRREIGIQKDGEIDLLRNDMPVGLSHIMIVDEHDNVSADRWVFNEAGQAVTYNITIHKNTYSSREKIKVDISAADSKGNPVESDFSLSVAKAVTVNKKSFNNNNLRQLADLITVNSDKLMPDINDYLIFYNSQELILNANGKLYNGDPQYLPEIEGHLISGNIKDRRTGEPLKNVNISLSFVGKVALCQFAKTNENGEFHFKTAEYGIRDIVIQPLSAEIKEYYVELNNPFTPATKKYNSDLFYPDISKLADINNVIISMQINNIYEPYTRVTAKKTFPGGNPDFYGKPDNSILLSKYIELTSIKEVVKEIIPGVTTVKKNDKINFRLFYQYQSKPFENSPMVLVDGVPVYDMEKVLAVNSKDLDKIDVFTTRYYISDIVMDGILHFVTKKGNLGVIDPDRSVYRVQYELPANRNEFYSPDYSTDKLLNDRIPDFRNTLYWNPEMHTDKTGKTAIEFYSSDESAEYIITVEGITSEGKTGAASMPLIIQ